MDAVYLWRFDFIPIMRFPSCSTVSLNLYDVMVFESDFMDAVTYSFYKRVETVLEEGECIVDAMSCTHKKRTFSTALIISVFIGKRCHKDVNARTLRT